MLMLVKLADSHIELQLYYSYLYTYMSLISGFWPLQVSILKQTHPFLLEFVISLHESVNSVDSGLSISSLQLQSHSFFLEKRDFSKLCCSLSFQASMIHLPMALPHLIAITITIIIPSPEDPSSPAPSWRASAARPPPHPPSAQAPFQVPSKAPG